MTTTDEALAPVDQFVTTLEGLARKDSSHGDLATLRRSVGRTLAESPDSYQLFYRLLPYQVRGREREEETYFLTATLFAVNPKSSPARNFGATMRLVALARGAGSAGIDRRMAVLLDASGDELGFRLRQAIRLAAAEDVGVNWPTLLSDLLWWEHPKRRVQRRWARSYFGGDAVSAGNGDVSQPNSESEE